MKILGEFFEHCYMFHCMRTGAELHSIGKKSYVKFSWQSTQLPGKLCMRGCSRSLLEDLLNVLTCLHQRILRPWRFYVDFLNNFGLSFAMCSAACALELGYTVSRKESYVKFMRQSTQLLGVLCVRGCSRSLLEDLLNVLTRVRGYSVLNFSKIIEF